MKILNSIIYLFLLFSVVFASCKSGNKSKKEQREESYIINDFKQDKLYPAEEQELQFKSNGSVIYGFEYAVNGKGPHPTVILLHGLPGNERNLDVAQNLRRAGYNVVYFNYRGSWGSKGTFGFNNAIEDTKAVIDYICDPAHALSMRVDTNRIALVGHSMGAGIALISGLQDKRVKAVTGISVFNPYTLLKGKDAPGNLLSLKEYLLTLGMLNCDPNQFLNDILKNIDQYNIEELAANTSKPVLVIDEHKNNNYLARYTKNNKKLQYKMWDTDHAFTNRRIALSKEIKTWLDKSLKQKTK
ncbi:MAG: alpha/beta fold hydrolase [Daejeonella sp.]